MLGMLGRPGLALGCAGVPTGGRAPTPPCMDGSDGILGPPIALGIVGIAGILPGGLAGGRVVAPAIAAGPAFGIGGIGGADSRSPGAALTRAPPC